MNARPARRSFARTLACLLFGLVTLLGWPRPIAAENRVTIRGNYYRETSTRVLQPMIHATVDAPDERLTVGAAYLLDAISSASIASGTAAATGGDNVFTELRHEVIGTVGSKLGDWTLGTYFRYSTETDYISRGTGLSVARELLQRTLTLSLTYNFGFDRIYRITNNIGGRNPWCGGAIASVDANRCTDEGTGANSNFFQVHHFIGGYAHAVHETVLALFNIEYAHQRGPHDNPYRAGLILNGLPETHPRLRNRVAITPALRWMIPKARLVFEPKYNFYVDDWRQRGHAPELRVHVRAARHLRLRARYRYYKQTGAFFWRSDAIYLPPEGACTRETPENCVTADVRAAPWDAHLVGGQLTWELDGLARHRGLHWLEGGYLQATYNHDFQNNRFGNARIGDLSLSLAF